MLGGEPEDPYQRAVSGRAERGSTRPTGLLPSPFGSGPTPRSQWLVLGPGSQWGSGVWTSVLVPAGERRAEQ